MQISLAAELIGIKVLLCVAENSVCERLKMGFVNLLLGRKKRPIASLAGDEQGIVIILFALLLPALLIVAALVINYAGIDALSYRGPFRDLTEMQAVADAAARAGAKVALLKNSTDDMIRAEATAVAAQNNYANEPDRNIALHVNIGSQIQTGAYANRTDAVEVIISQSSYKFPFFASVLGFGDGVTLTARAVAGWFAAPCMVALNTQSHGQTGIDFSGAQTNITAACGLYSNYPGDKSIKATSGTVCANTLIMSGGLDGTVNGCENVTAEIVPNNPPIGDPFSSLPFTMPTGLDQYGSWTDYNKRYGSWNDVTVLKPGAYPAGISFSSGNHTFEAGTYYIYPDQTLVVTGGIIDGTAGVTFVFLPSTKPNSGGYRFNGGQITLTAPDSGTYEGLVIASKASASPLEVKTTVTLDGGIYAPNSTVSFSTPISGQSQCLFVVADSINFAGGPVFGKDCLPSTMNLSVFQSADLVE